MRNLRNFLMACVVTLMMFAGLADAATVYRYVILGAGQGGSDANAGTAWGTAWLTLNKAVTATGQANSGDMLDISVRTPTNYGNDVAHPVADKLYIAAANVGINYYVHHETPATTIYLTHNNISALIYMAAGLTSGSIRLDYVNYTGVGRALDSSGLIWQASGVVGTAVTLNNCTLTGNGVADRCVYFAPIGAASGLNALRLTNCTISGCAEILNITNCPLVRLEGCTVTLNASTAPAVTLFYAYQCSTLQFVNNTITSTITNMNSQKLFVTPTAGLTEFTMTGNVIDTESTTTNITTQLVGLVTTRGSGVVPASANVTIHDNVITCAMTGAAVGIGCTDTGATRAAILATLTSQSRIFGTVSVKRNTIHNAKAHASSSALVVGIGCNGADITDNYLYGSSTAHGCEIAASNCTFERNIGYGSLTLINAGDNNVCRYNTCFGVGNADSAAMLHGIPAGTSWGAPTGGEMTHNVAIASVSGASAGWFCYGMGDNGTDTKIDMNCYLAVASGAIPVTFGTTTGEGKTTLAAILAEWATRTATANDVNSTVGMSIMPRYVPRRR